MASNNKKIMGMDQAEGKRGYSIVEAEVPDSEMSDYVHVLRAISQGRGSYTFYLTGYSEVPATSQKKSSPRPRKTHNL